MQDFEDRMKERWSQRRKKAYNWKKLLLMGLVLVALWYTMSRLQNAGNVFTTPSATTVDSLAADKEQLP